jgi:hypothetical protein
MDHDLDAPNVTTSKGEGGAKEYSANTCISPKSGDIKDMGDMEIPSSCMFLTFRSRFDRVKMCGGDDLAKNI